MSAVKRLIIGVLPYLVGPLPIVLTILVICLYVGFSPPAIIDGRVDNDIAAMIINFFILPFFYLILSGILALEIWIIHLFKTDRLIYYIFVSVVVAIFLAYPYARMLYDIRVLYEPQINESLPLIFLNTAGVYIFFNCLMTLTWWLVDRYIKKRIGPDADGSINWSNAWDV